MSDEAISLLRKLFTDGYVDLIDKQGRQAILVDASWTDITFEEAAFALSLLKEIQAAE